MFCPRTSFALGLDWTLNCRSIHANNTFKRVLRPHFCFKSPALHSLPGVTSTRTNNESNDRIWARYDFWLITWNWETFILWLLTPPPPSVNPSVHPSSKLLLWQTRRVVWTLNNSADVSAKDPDLDANEIDVARPHMWQTCSCSCHYTQLNTRTRAKRQINLDPSKLICQVQFGGCKFGTNKPLFMR